MNKNSLLIPVLALGAAGVVALAAWGSDEDEISIDQVPAAVRATILREVGNGKIAEIERETERGKTVYEAELLIGGKEIDIMIAADGTLLGKENDEQEGEQEREVTEAEVPADALAMLKKRAGGAKITEFAEETEHGHTFYEGSWRAAAGGNMDALVTTTGDLVEIEERLRADQVPAAVLASGRQAAGRDARMAFERKTLILYEVKFQKGDRRHELLLTANGRTIEEEIEEGKGEGDDEDHDGHDHDDDDDHGHDDHDHDDDDD